MKIKHDEILIEDANPFSNCKLDRKKYATALTKIIDTYADGFVIAINNEWGTGKTTFIKMWQQELKNLDYHTLYFNAWENDFDSNPLVALMAELNTLTNKSNKKLFKSLIEKGAVLTKNILPALIKSISAKFLDKEIISDALENVTKAATEILEDEIKEYTTKKNSLKEFKLKLEEFVKETQDNKPIIFIVDELDRCRPNYAVEILEQIKHFFSVKGIVFVLSIDKTQLGNAIRGVYGSEQINADEYLRRFIDIEYSIQPPDIDTYINYLSDYFKFNLFFQNTERTKSSELRNDKNSFLKIATIIFKHKNLTLRQQEKIFVHARIALKFFDFNNYVFPSLFIILVFIKNFYPEFYNKLKSKKLSLDEMIDDFSKILPTNINDEDIKYLIQLEANLVYMYSNYVDKYKKNPLRSRNQAGEEVFTVKSRIDKSENKIFERYLDGFLNNWNISDTELSYLLNKIDFTGSISF